MVCNRSAVARVGEHHSFLHGPGVAAVHEADQAIITISASDRVCGIDGFAFDEERVELRQDEAWFKVIISKLEAKVRRLGATAG